MALREALVDRARVVRREAATERVEGTTRHVEVRGPWFACRLSLSGPEIEAEGNGRIKVRENESILYATTAEDGSGVELGADDVVEVRSNQPGADGRWSVDGRPLVIRKRLNLLGAGYAQVRRVLET